MKKFANILVPVEGILADDQAIQLACQTARQNKAAVVVVHVIEVQRTMPLESEDAVKIERADSVLKHAETVARENGFRIETELLQARAAGSAVVNEAVERRIDLIVMGAPYRRPLGEFHLGSTANYILQNATCQVWFCRESPPIAVKRESPKKS
jgi:nucleotide-binding universal stress UspA family protein